MKQSWLSVFAVSVFILAAAPGQAEEKDSIWGQEIQKQAFDKEPLREIKIPAWLDDVPYNTYCISQFGLYEKASQAGAIVGDLFFMDPMYVNYDSKFLKERNPNLPLDQVDKQVAEFRKRGMRIISGHGPWLQREIYISHPEWRAIDTNTTQIPEADMEKTPHGGRLCQLGPWGDYLIEILAEILTKYDVDGFNFDGIHHFGPCYCQFCREAYKQETGKEIPTLNLDDPEYRRYLIWEDRRLEAYVERMQTRLKGIKPDCAIVTYTTNAGRFGHFADIPHGMPARMNLLFDAPDQEFWMDETNRGNSVVPAFANAMIYAVTNHRVAYSSPYYMAHGNPYGMDGYPHEEMLRRALLVVTWGARPAIAFFPQRYFDTELDCVRELKKIGPWTTHKEPEPWAALVMGDYTRQFYGRAADKVEERYLANVFGAFRVCIEEHLPVTVINEWNLNEKDLAPYKLLILANTACVSDEQAAAIRQFVGNGGGLLASVDASLYDETGAGRKDFALADVFGAHYKGVPSAKSSGREELDINFTHGLGDEYWARHKNIFDLRLVQPIHPSAERKALERTIATDPVAFKGQAVAVEADQSSTVALMAVRETTPPPQPPPQLPAVVAHSFGKGKVIYMAAGLDSAYYLYPYSYQRHLLAGAMRWAAGAEPTFKVDAPMCVQATIFRQKKDGERLIVHLYNDINSAGNHAKPDDDVPLREEVVPIHDIGVSLTGYPISRIHLEPDGTDLKMTKEGNTVRVTVPRLEIHSMVVAELE